MKTFFTSDTHFGHANIIKYSKRPFKDVEQMDRAMIDAWNAVVRPGDTVYHLGDFSMRQASDVLKQLNGDKHLILGNHDRGPHKGWSSVREMAKITVEDQSLFLCHYPMREWPGKWSGTVHLYGHVHGGIAPLPGSMEVSADVWGGKPIQLQEILRVLKPFAPDSVDGDPLAEHKPLAGRQPFRVSGWMGQ